MMVQSLADLNSKTSQVTRQLFNDRLKKSLFGIEMDNNQVEHEPKFEVD